MKTRNVLLSLLVCLSLSSYGQNVTPFSDKKVINELTSLANKLCECIIKIGSTHSGLTEAERDHLRTKVVPKLFIKFDYRYMWTTGGSYGQDKRKKEMGKYFFDLQRQSRSQLGQERSYDISPEFYTNHQGIVWFPDTVYADGSVQEYALLTIYQTYVLSRGNKGDMKYGKRVEVDAKEIKVLRLKTDGEVKYGLGDVHRVERLKTTNH